MVQLGFPIFVEFGEKSEMISVKTFVFNPFMENTVVLSSENGEATIVDPGCYDKVEKEVLRDFIKSEGLKVTQLVNTHCHIDHVFGNSFVKNEYNVKLGIHKNDHETLRAVKAYAPSYGFQHYEEAEPDYFFSEEDSLVVGGVEFKILFVPGHSPGHVAFYQDEQKLCIGGDVLFRGSIGRTDLPGGHFETLIESIRQEMFAMDPETVVYPGHGEVTTIDHEMRTNPFCAVL